MYTTKASLNTSPPYISISNVMAITNTCNVNYHFDREREKYTNAQLIYNKAKQYAYRCIGEVSDNHNQYPLKCCQILFLDMSKRGKQSQLVTKYRLVHETWCHDSPVKNNPRVNWTRSFLHQHQITRFSATLQVTNLHRNTIQSNLGTKALRFVFVTSEELTKRV